MAIVVAVVVVAAVAAVAAAAAAAVVVQPLASLVDHVRYLRVCCQADSNHLRELAQHFQTLAQAAGRMNSDQICRIASCELTGVIAIDVPGKVVL